MSTIRFSFTWKHAVLLVGAICSTAGMPASETTKKSVSVEELTRTVDVVGRLHVPIGTIISLSGSVVRNEESAYYGSEWQLYVNKIDGVATQEIMKLPLSFARIVGFERELSADQTYDLMGFETLSFVGLPNSFLAKHRGEWHDVPFEPLSSFVVLSGAATAPTTFHPSDYAGRAALIQGVAVNHRGSAYISGPHWRVLVWAGKKWPDQLLGKKVETFSVITQSEDDVFMAQNPVPRLQDLDDQIGFKVDLRGQLLTDGNGNFRLCYRDDFVILSNTEKSATALMSVYGKSISVNGHLSAVKGPEKGLEYVIALAEWSESENLLFPERCNL